MQGVYKIRNTVNNKIYVGSSINIESRFKSHIAELNKNSHNNRYLQRAWNKYGADSFEFSIIELVDDKDILRAREQYYIEKLNVTNHDIGYNILPNTDIGLGVSASREVREKISKSCSGEKNPHYGKKHSKETIDRIKESKRIANQRKMELKRQQWIDEQHRCEFCGVVMLEKFGSGRFCSIECSRKHCGVMNKSVVHTAEWNSKVSSSLTGRKLTEEHAEKISIAASERLSDPQKNPMYGKTHSAETKEKISNKLKSMNIQSSRFSGHTHTEESKKKISEGVKRARYDKQ